MYSMCMLKERLQILVTLEQRRRLEVEARQRGTSVSSLIREAVDSRYGVVRTGDRRRALDEIRELKGRYLSPEELNRLSTQERDEVIDDALGQRRP